MGRNRNAAVRQRLRQIGSLQNTVDDLAITEAPQEVDTGVQPQPEVAYEYSLIPGLVTIPKYEIWRFLYLSHTILEFERDLISVNKAQGILLGQDDANSFFRATIVKLFPEEHPARQRFLDQISCPVIEYFWRGSSEPSNLRLPHGKTDKTLFKPIHRTQLQRNEGTLLMENSDGIRIVIPFIGYLPLASVHLQDIMKRAHMCEDHVGLNKAMICQLWKGILINIYFFESDSLQAQKLAELDDITSWICWRAVKKIEDLDRVQKPLNRANATNVLRRASIESTETGTSVGASKHCKPTKMRRRKRKRKHACKKKINSGELLEADINDNTEKQARARLRQLQVRKRLVAADFFDCPNQCPSCELSGSHSPRAKNDQVPTSSAQLIRKRAATSSPEPRASKSLHILPPSNIISGQGPCTPAQGYNMAHCGLVSLTSQYQPDPSRSQGQNSHTDSIGLLPKSIATGISLPSKRVSMGACANPNSTAPKTSISSKPPSTQANTNPNSTATKNQLPSRSVSTVINADLSSPAINLSLPPKPSSKAKKRRRRQRH